MNRNRQNQVASLGICECGHLLRRVAFDSLADGGRRCIDYWDLLDIKRPIYDCPTCGASLSTQTVKEVTAICKGAAPQIVHEIQTAARLYNGFSEILYGVLLRGVAEAEHHQAMALLQEHQTAGRLTIEAVWALENAIGLLETETAEGSFLVGLDCGRDPRRMVCAARIAE